LQFKHLVIPIFEATHKDEHGRPLVGVFLFDNSKSHGIMAPDALVVSSMNLKPGGAQRKMRDGWFMGGEVRVVQTMCFAEGDTIQFEFNENNGEHKGKAAMAATVVDSSSWVLGTAKGIRQVCASKAGLDQVKLRAWF